MSQISKVINHISQIWESRIQVINTASLDSRSDLFICICRQTCILKLGVNSLEVQLTSRSATEQFLATKIATLDTSLRDVSRIKEETETTLQTENRQLCESNESLKAYAEARDACARRESSVTNRDA